MAQGRIDREDRHYHDEFNKQRYQRGDNGQFAMPMDSTEKLKMPDVSHLSEKDYSNLAGKLEKMHNEINHHDSINSTSTPK